MAGPFDDVRAAMVTALAADAAVTVPAVGDPAALPPFVLVDVPTVTGTAGIGAWTCTYPVKIVVPAPGDAAAADALLGLLAAVLGVLGPAAARPDVYRRPGVDAELPCYVLTYQRDVPNPNC